MREPKEGISLTGLDRWEFDKLASLIGHERIAFIDRHGRVCGYCLGAGVRSYGDTSTYRGGVGGQAFTPDVCDHCWGSGCHNHRWPSWREVRDA